MDAIWVVVWLVVFAVITGLAGLLLYSNRKKKLAEASSPKEPTGPHRPHGHHRPGH